MRQQLGVAPTNPADVIRLQDVVSSSSIIATMWRLADVINGGAPSSVYGGVLGLDCGAAADTYAVGMQSLDCSDGRITA